MEKRFVEAVAVLMGIVIGAGVLGIPYVVSKSGFLTGLVVIILLGIAVILVNLSVGEVALRTNGNHQLTGYAEKYLGKKGKFLMTIDMLVGIYGALLAYIIGVGEALSTVFGLNSFIFSIIFFVFVSGLVYLGIKSIAESDLFLMSLVIGLILIISCISVFSGKLNFMNLNDFSFNKIFIPYGVVLFAFLGASAVPEMREVLRWEKESMKKAIIIGGLIPLFLYILFAFSIVGVFGEKTSEIATIGLGQEFGRAVVIFANLFATFAMMTSFLGLGLALKEMYNFDYKLNNNISWVLACFVPLIAFLIGFKDFINVIGLTGVFAGGLEGILIVLMLWKSKKKCDRKPEYSLPFAKLIGIILIIIFVLGIINQIR